MKKLIPEAELNLSFLDIVFFASAEKISADAIENLKAIAEAHNSTFGLESSKKIKYKILMKVFRRGVAAHKTNSSSRAASEDAPDEWGYYRVEGFIYAIVNGKFRNKQFDIDLLQKLK